MTDFAELRSVSATNRGHLNRSCDGQSLEAEVESFYLGEPSLALMTGTCHKRAVAILKIELERYNQACCRRGPRYVTQVDAIHASDIGAYYLEPYRSSACRLTSL